MSCITESMSKHMNICHSNLNNKTESNKNMLDCTAHPSAKLLNQFVHFFKISTFIFGIVKDILGFKFKKASIHKLQVEYNIFFVMSFVIFCELLRGLLFGFICNIVCLYRGVSRSSCQARKTWCTAIVEGYLH